MAPSQAARHRGALVCSLLILVSSLAGALIFPLSTYGRTTLTAASKEWMLLLLGIWLPLSAWAFIFSLLTRKTFGWSGQQSLCRAAVCHAPLLLCFGLVSTLYSDDLSYHTYANSARGLFVFQPMAKSYVLLSPAVAQALMVAFHRRHTLARALPLAAIISASLVLRSWNLNWGLPALLHPDEHRYLGPAFLMYATGDLHPHYFENPSLLIYLNYALFKLLSQQAQAFRVLSDFLNLGIVDPRGDYLVVLAARGISTLAGTLTVVSVYQIGKELFGRKAGIFAASLLAVCFLHVRNSHYSTNDILATFFMTLSVLYSSRVLAKGRITDYLLAGLFGGLGVSAKYNVGFFALALLVAHVGRMRNTAKPILSLGSCFPLAAGGLVSIAAFLAGTPYAVLDSSSFVADFRNQSGYGGSPWYGQEDQVPLLMYLSALARGFGPIALGLAATGLVLAVRTRRWPVAVLVSIPVAYLLFMSTQKLFFARFAIPTVPFVALFAGYAIQHLSNIQVRWLGQAGIALLVLSASIVWPSALSWQHAVLLGRSDTRSLTAAWIDQHLPPEASLAMEGFAQLDAIFRWRGHHVEGVWVYWPENEGATSTALSGKYEYVVVSSFGYGPWQRKDDEPSVLPPRYQSLREGGRLLALFGAGHGGSEIPYAQDDMYTPFWHLMDRERPGPTVRIYRMDRPQPTQ